MVTEETRAGTRRKISRGHTALKWLGGCRKRRKDISVYIYIYFCILDLLCSLFCNGAKVVARGPTVLQKGEGQQY